MDFVIYTTIKHMVKSVDISIQKTFERIREFDGDQEKSSEVFRTLTILHSLKKQLAEQGIEKLNSEPK